MIPRRNRACIAAILLAAACIPAPAWSADPPPDLAEMDLESLMKVDVATVSAASKHEEKATRAPSSVTVVTADEIQKFGWRTIADVIRSLRGFYVTYDRNYSYLGVRGFGRPGDYNSRILLLVDGHQTNDAIFDSAYIGTEFILDIDLVDRIEIVRGPVSALYGGNAFFAVIDVKTKSGAQIDGVQAAAAGGNFDTYKARLTWGRAFANGPDVVASGTWFSSHGPALYYKEFDDPSTSRGIVNNDYDKAPSFFLKARWLDVTFIAANVNREKGIPTAPFGTAFADRRQHTIDMRTFAEARWERAFAGHLDVMARAYYDQYDYLGHYIYGDGGVPGSRYLNHDDAHGKWVGVEARVSKQVVDRLRLSCGAEHKQFYELAQKNWSATTEYLDEAHRLAVSAAFAQADADIASWLSSSLAARYDQYGTFGGAINPRFSLIAHAGEAFAFKYLYGRAFRPPNEYEMNYRAVDQKAPATLDPETIGTHELVYEHYLGRRWRWAAGGFYTRIENLVSLARDTADGMMVFRNAGSMTSYGAEAEAEFKTASGWLARASYTWQRTSDDAGGGLTNSPAHMVKAALSAPLLRDRLFLSADEEVLSARATLQGREVDAHVLTNVTLLCRGLPAGLAASATVYNLFDQIYADPGSEEHRQDALFQDGRTFRLTLSYTF